MRSFFKIYLIATSIVATIIVLQLNLAILPKFSEILSEFSPEIEKSITCKIHNMTVVFLIFVFVFNFYFWKVDSQLEREKRKFEGILKLNPEDTSTKKKLNEIKKRQNRYFTIAKVIFTLILGFVVSFTSFVLIKPLYYFLETLK